MGEDFGARALEPVEAQPIMSFGKRQDFGFQHAQKDLLWKLHERLARDFRAL
jgi:hypothetical protein